MRFPWRRRLAALTGLVLLCAVPPRANGWGEHGHTIAGKAAALKLPAEMPAFFRNASDQLGYLTAEPDRWRDPSAAAANGAWNPDHAINLELVPAGALMAPDRFVYLGLLEKQGLTSAVGMAPFRTLEMFERLRTEFRLWRAATDPQKRGWIEQRIVNDAGILGHYVTDGSQPLHTSVSHHGWVGQNPDGFTTDRSIHARFEGEYVDAHVQLNDLLPQIPAAAHELTDEQATIAAYFQTTHTHLRRLYELEKQESFNTGTQSPESKAFVTERLAAGATMLRDLWWTAWVESATPLAHPPHPAAAPTPPG